MRSLPRPALAVLVATWLTAQLLAASVFTLTATGQAARPPSVSIAVVGDSYTAGVQDRSVWPTLLAQRTGWSVANFALPNAGYVSDGLGGHAFAYQVERAQAALPDTIAIVGGLADVEYADSGRIAVGAIEAINKAKLGGQDVLVIGPTWYQEPVPDVVRKVSRAIRSVADDAGIPFLDALDPPWLTRTEMGSDLSAPTDEGQSVLADKIAAWFRSEVG